MPLPAPRLLGEPRVVWNAQAELGEGTCWSPREQALYWVDILGQCLYRYRPQTGERREWAFDETISAVAERATQPGLAITLRRGYAFFDPRTGALQRLPEAEPERTRNRFNDGKCDTLGRFWAGTMDFDCEAPTGALYRLDADGRCTRVLDAGFAVTNGPTWSRDGRTMYFNETARARIHAFDFDPEHGTLSNQRLWLRLPPGEGYPDGMTTDAEGRLWIAHWGGSRVSCRDPETAEELARIELPTAHITNVAFGGPEMKTLFITSARTGLSEEQLEAQPWAGSLFTVETDVMGVAPGLFAG